MSPCMAQDMCAVTTIRRRRAEGTEGGSPNAHRISGRLRGTHIHFVSVLPRGLHHSTTLRNTSAWGNRSINSIHIEQQQPQPPSFHRHRSTNTLEQPRLAPPRPPPPPPQNNMSQSFFSLNASSSHTFPTTTFFSSSDPLRLQPDVLATAVLVLGLLFLSDNLARRRTHSLREKTAAGVRTIYGVECRAEPAAEKEAVPVKAQKEEEEAAARWGVWDGLMQGVALMARV